MGRARGKETKNRSSYKQHPLLCEGAKKGFVAKMNYFQAVSKYFDGEFACSKEKLRCQYSGTRTLGEASIGREYARWSRNGSAAAPRRGTFFTNPRAGQEYQWPISRWLILRNEER